MEQRDLDFSSYADVIREMESLGRKGYRKGGSWSLGQICAHLSFYYRGSLEGFTVKLPWLLRVTLGRMMLKSALAGKKRKPGGPTAPPSVFESTIDDKKALADAVELLHRLEKNTAQLFPSALYGSLTNEQWKILHLGHSAHHLGFLHPV